MTTKLGWVKTRFKKWVIDFLLKNGRYPTLGERASKWTALCLEYDRAPNLAGAR